MISNDDYKKIFLSSEISINNDLLNLLINLKFDYILLYPINYPVEKFSHFSLNNFRNLQNILQLNNITILNNGNIKININKVLYLKNLLLLIITKLETIKYKSINKDFFGDIFIILECDKLDFQHNIINLCNNNIINLCNNNFNKLTNNKKIRFKSFNKNKDSFIKFDINNKLPDNIIIHNKSIIQNIYKEVKMKIITLKSKKAFHVLLPNYDYGFIVTNSINNKLYMKCFRQSCNVRAYRKDNKYYLKIVKETNDIENHNHESDNKIIIDKINQKY